MSENTRNMNLAITVDDGSRRVPIMNTQGEEIGAFVFRPTDVDIIDRYNRMAERFDDVTEPLAALGADTKAAPDISDPRYSEALREASKRLYAAVNELFDSPDAAEAFFGHMSPFSPVNGEFYCLQVLAQVGQFISAQFDTETKAMSKKARRYLK